MNIEYNFARKRMLHIVFSFFLAFIIFLSNFDTVLADEPSSQQNWPASPEIFAEAGVLIEASTGTVLFDKKMNDKMYPASITKILTTLLAFEQCNMTETVDFSHYAVYSLEYGDANIGMKEGEQLSMIDCLYGVMLASANECATATGEHVAKKSQAYTDALKTAQASGEQFDESKIAIQVFADMMNERAKQAGAINSHFNNPNGLFDENHYTTCYDMAMITRDAIKNEEFLKLESNTTYTINPTNLTPEPRYVINRHKMLLPSSAVYYDGALGGKTGYVDQSGNTLVTFAKRNGMTLISVVMKSNSTNVYNDTKLLLDYGFNNFNLYNIASNETKFSFDNHKIFNNANSIFEDSEQVLHLNKNGNVILPKSANFSDAKSEITFLDNKEKKDNSIASLDYYYCDTHIGSTTLDLSSSADDSFKFGPALNNKSKSSNSDKITFIKINIWILLLILLIVIILIGILYFIYTSRTSGRRRFLNKRSYRPRRRRSRKNRLK